jgi:hypothetical protein
VVELLSHVWRKNGDFLEVEPAEMETPLTAVLDGEAGATRVDPEWLPSDQQDLRRMDREELMCLVLKLIEERDSMRQASLKTMMGFLFARGPEPLSVLERCFMVARAVHDRWLWRANGTQVAALLGRSKQDWQNLEESVIEELVRRWTRDTAVMGAGKSFSARQRYSADKRGNTSRKLGRRRGDELPRGTFEERDEAALKVTAAARARAEKMRVEYERRKLAEEIGCSPEDIDLSRISPKGVRDGE